MIKDIFLCVFVPLLWSGVGEGDLFPMDKSVGYSYDTLSGHCIKP